MCSRNRIRGLWLGLPLLVAVGWAVVGWPNVGILGPFRRIVVMCTLVVGLVFNPGMVLLLLEPPVFVAVDNFPWGDLCGGLWGGPESP